jgi:D-alanyl-D-alanine carboxypeptidase
MAAVDFGARAGLRYSLLASAAVAAALTITSDVADARRHPYRGHAHHAHAARGHHRHARSEEYSPPFASIVVDANSGGVLQASNPDALRHPASLTKVMTLYLLFERLESGRLKLESALKISEHAAEQAPTKLALKPGQTITVEDAIKGIVTKSANDAAVAVAEALAGDEDSFAKLMTQKAHALGMMHTTYVNASGLPDDDQITTARDQALLGRAIQERFPRYYRYFSTEIFVFHGEEMRNHNHLLGVVDGVDGIKTGFTRASGFNLLTSLHRDGRYLVAVVMGGPSASERDERMRELLRAHIKEAAVRRTTPMIAEVAERRDETARKAPAPHVDRTATASVESRAAAGSSDPIRPVLVKTISYRTAPVQTSSLAPMPALVPVSAPASPAQAQAAQPTATNQPPTNSQIRAEIASAAPAIAAPPTPSAAPTISSVGPTVVASRVADPSVVEQTLVEPSVVGSSAVGSSVAAAASSVTAGPRNVVPPAPRAGIKAAAAAEPPPVSTVIEPGRSAETTPIHMQPAQIEPAPEAHAFAPIAQPAPTYAAPHIHAHGGWLIQIGAFDDEIQAKEHLSAAQMKVHGTLAAKDPFTERIQKGDKALYRARFAGFDKATAEAACKALKRSDFECMALKD